MTMTHVQSKLVQNTDAQLEMDLGIKTTGHGAVAGPLWAAVKTTETVIQGPLWAAVKTARAVVRPTMRVAG